MSDESGTCGDDTDHWDSRVHESEDLYRDASIRWGYEAQRAKAAEEFSELAAVCARDLNGQADAEQLLEELVDARIMIEQIAYQLTDESLESTVDKKLYQLDGRLHGGPVDE